MSTRQIDRAWTNSSFDVPGTIDPGLTDGQLSPGGYFVFSSVGVGWTIKADIRESQNLPNIILANAPLAVVQAFETLLTTGPQGSETFRAFVAAVSIEQVAVDSHG